MKRSIVLLVTLAVLFSAGGAALAQTGSGYDLTWWTADGGGGTASSSGYTLMGTAGQPDAGAILGGGYTLSGGFWAVAAQATTQRRTYLPVVLK